MSRCASAEPHPSHWHTIRVDGITYAAFQCPGVRAAEPTEEDHRG